MPICQVCQREFKLINKNHLQTHDLTLEKYIELYGDPNFSPDKPKKSRASASSVKKKMDTAEDMTYHKKRILDELYEEAGAIKIPPYVRLLGPEDMNWFRGNVIKTVSDLKEMALSIKPSDKDPFMDQIVGIGISLTSADHNLNVYLPFNHVDPTTEAKRPGQMEERLVLQELKPLLEDPSIKKIFHESITPSLFLSIRGINIQNISWDTKGSMQLLNENTGDLSLKSIFEFYKSEIKEDLKLPFDLDLGSYPDKFEKVSFKYAPINIGAIYCAKEALAIRLLKEFQEPCIRNIGGLVRVHTMEHQLLPVLIDMRRIGIRADREMAAVLAKEFRAELEAAQPFLYEKLGNINLNSTQQLSRALYDDLGIPDISNKRSTRKEVLQELVDLDLPMKGELKQIVDQLLVYRGHGKILGTYLEGIERYINPITQKVHCIFDPTGARTGRFSSSNPNLSKIGPCSSDAA